AGCKPKPPADPVPPKPVAAATPAPAPAAAPAPEPIDKTAQAVVLGYHRFENPPRDPLALSTAEFRQQMQALKDLGIAVIPMDDFLAWRRGEKSIPARSAVITIDDGYNDSYSQAWPVLKEFGYPFTMYVYTDYISKGGRSITWGQLEQMRDAGVDIGSHTVSHDNLVKPKRAKNANYGEWLMNELKGSKDLIEQHLGIKVKTLAYPFGIHNANVMAQGLAAGYEALFTVEGKKIGFDVDPAKVGRYVIQSGHPIIFKAATSFGSATLAPAAVSAGAPAGAQKGSIPTLPAAGETIGEQMPLIEADLSSMGNVDPKSVEMRISGFGQVSAVYDPVSKKLTYQPVQRLRERVTTIAVSAKGPNGRVETRWSFTIDPATAVPTPEREVPAPAPETLPQS
ncbi:MAG TPA: polysaccharide deacetylase family protein, partial [Chthoniobacterales bacterium]